MAVSPIDRIGDRLDHPENVPEELKHLIADDVARVEKILSIPVSGDVLDVGCSDGAITRRIREKWGVHAVGADVRAASHDEFAITWDVREPWPYAPAFTLRPFSAVYACEVFEHLTDADAQLAFTNILAVLKPGGDLIVSVPNVDVSLTYQAGMRDRWRWPDHRSVWTGQKLQRFLGSFFARVASHPLDPRDVGIEFSVANNQWESVDRSIWLIVHASGKK